jgi:glycosyltransferase involved in cell wall biosynthesis
MFAGHLVDGETGMVFPARQPRAMADKIDRLLGDPALYARLSCNATEA